jgi:hypothetical protein
VLPVETGTVVPVFFVGVGVNSGSLLPCEFDGDACGVGFGCGARRGLVEPDCDCPNDVMEIRTAIRAIARWICFLIMLTDSFMLSPDFQIRASWSDQRGHCDAAKGCNGSLSVVVY